MEGHVKKSTIAGAGEICKDYSDKPFGCKIMDKIVIIETDDWKVVYVNDEKWIEGHRIYEEIWFDLGKRLPDVQWNDIKRYYFNQDKMDELHFWDFPTDFNKIPKILFV
jgi:hypothetical protein